MSLQVIEGTWEEIEQRKDELVGHWLRVTITPKAAEGRKANPAKRPSALGKYAYVANGSEEFAREKRAEIEREDRAR